MVDVDVPADIAAMNFEEAVAELEQIVRRLEGGQVRLDEAILFYERGALLKRHCERKLNEAQQRLESLEQDGWRITYSTYTAVHGEWLPARLSMQRDAVRVRLLVDEWQW